MIKNKITKKIFSAHGESIVETLIALMIVAMSFTILAGAIVTAARVNAGIKNENETFSLTSTDDNRKAIAVDGNYTVNFDGTNVPVKVYETNGYYYYEKK